MRLHVYIEKNHCIIHILVVFFFGNSNIPTRDKSRVYDKIPELRFFYMHKITNISLILYQKIMTDHIKNVYNAITTFAPQTFPNCWPQTQLVYNYNHKSCIVVWLSIAIFYRNPELKVKFFAYQKQKTGSLLLPWSENRVEKWRGIRRDAGEHTGFDTGFYTPIVVSQTNYRLGCRPIFFFGRSVLVATSFGWYGIFTQLAEYGHTASGNFTG